MSGLSSFIQPARWFYNWLYGVYDDQGLSKRVSTEKALSITGVWGGVNKIAGHISRLPIGVHRMVPGGKEPEPSHSISRLLRMPNAYQTSHTFRMQLATHAIIEGNARAAIVRDPSGRAIELIPLLPECTATGMFEGVKVHASRPPIDDRLRLFFRNVEGKLDAKSDKLIMLDDVQVVHVMGLSLNGVWGCPLRQVLQRTLNSIINREERLNNQSQQGFTGSLMITAPQGIFRREEEAKEFLEHFAERHHSPEKAGKPGLLREGMTAQLLESSNRDAEMVDNRKFDRQEVAIALGLESILGDDESVAYNSAVEKNRAYRDNTLAPWLHRFEQEFDKKLLPSRQFLAGTHHVQFDTSALLQMNYAETVQANSVAISSRQISPNEARAQLGYLPYAGGDAYENPAITPGRTGAEQQSSGEADDTDAGDAENNDVANLRRSRIAQLIRTEAKRVEYYAGLAHASGTPGKFLQSVDRWYSTNWTLKLADAFEELGMDRELSAAHCQESQEQILELCSTVQPADLLDAVRRLTSNWEARADNLGVLECST